jgi:hypothetical protein
MFGPVRNCRYVSLHQFRSAWLVEGELSTFLIAKIKKLAFAGVVSPYVHLNLFNMNGPRYLFNMHGRSIGRA